MFQDVEVKLVCLMCVVGFCFVVCSKYCGPVFDFSQGFCCAGVGKCIL